jgi:hypothetical protein
MLTVLCDKSSAEVEGSSEDLRDLSRSIKACRGSCSIRLSVPAQLDERGLRYLRNLVIKVESDSLKISEVNEDLHVTGSKEKLDLLADNINWLFESQADGASRGRDHLHIEFYPGHFFLSEDALPLVVVRQD